ncbi:hypothetical protein [Bradyrhizobium sp. RDM4]|uniref:hypothetical protein n=1 Tax=Bradyrhizobium sp. RDM4 TaxID=3378765 RepID=UPI0038FCAC4F
MTAAAFGHPSIMFFPFDQPFDRVFHPPAIIFDLLFDHASSIPHTPMRIEEPASAVRPKALHAPKKGEGDSTDDIKHGPTRVEAAKNAH